ncbi:MAG TPA: amidohydrolase family protein [Terriglobales bacterium]|nr:amidohydrolase family protein [Terriglobales bacterium]
MIIDCHCHAGQGDKMTAPWNTNAPLGTYLRRARAAGIHKTIITAPFHSDYAKANEQTARLVAHYPGRLIGFAFVHAKRDAGRIFRMVEYAVRHWAFRGIKVHGHEAMPTREVCETAKALRVPILVDITSRFEVVDMLAPQYPEVNFIVAHLGSNTDDFRAHQHVVYQLARYRNVYADTSAVRQYDYIVEAIKHAGPQKILFGSDGPWLHPGVEIHKIRLLRLPPEQEALVLGGNVLRLLHPARLPRKEINRREDNLERLAQSAHFGVRFDEQSSAEALP